ncbi:MAG: pyridine nucleotide-disulfide oxidoreductase, partial [Desulfobacterales bacterium]|nr:pyridine nucleotide-disulfide oxidoreductase [Desulfobacterales bacterium]
MEMAGMEAQAPPNRQDGEAFLQQLRATFAQMPNDIPLLLFTDRAQEDVFAQANRQVIRAFRELTDRITLREYGLDHEKARELNVTVAPTLVIAPDQYNIRWVGAPMGEEARTFLELMILVGTGQSNVSDQSLKVLDRIDGPRNVKVFISPSCP